MNYPAHISLRTAPGSAARRLRRLAVLLACALTGAAAASAQTADAQLGQYYEATTLYNAGATGSTDFLRVRAGTRLQWIGIDNAPKDFFLVGDMPFQIGKKRLGVGAVVGSDSRGLFSNLDVSLQASYKIKLFKGTLSVGVQGSYFNQKFKGSDVVLPDDDDFHEGTDEAIPTQDVTGSAFDLGAGIWYTRGKWWGGIGGLHLLQPSVKLKVETASGSDAEELEYFETELTRTLYLMGGGNIRLNNTLFELEPSLMLAYDFTDFTGQADLRVRYNNFLTVGVGYRYDSAIKAELGAEYRNFYLGYVYEYPLNAIAKASSGTHEIMAGYRLKIDFSKKNRNRHRSIRLM